MANAREMLNNIPRFQEGGEVEPDPFPTIRESLAELGANPDKYESILAKTDDKFHWEKVFRPKTTLEVGAITLLAAAKQSGAEPNEYLSRLAPYFESRIQSLPDLYNVLGYVDPRAPSRAVLTRTAREDKGSASTLPHELEHTLQLQDFDARYQKGKDASAASGEKVGIHTYMDNVSVPGRPNPVRRFGGMDSFKGDLQKRLSELPEEERKLITAKHPVFGDYLSSGTELFARIRAKDMLDSAKGQDFLQTELGQKLFPTDRDRSYFIGSTLPNVPKISPPYTFESTEEKKKPVTNPNTSYARQLYNKLTAPKEYQEGGEVTQEDSPDLAKALTVLESDPLKYKSMYQYLLTKGDIANLNDQNLAKEDIAALGLVHAARLSNTEPEAFIENIRTSLQNVQSKKQDVRPSVMLQGSSGGFNTRMPGMNFDVPYVPATLMGRVGAEADIGQDTARAGLVAGGAYIPNMGVMRNPVMADVGYRTPLAGGTLDVGVSTGLQNPSAKNTMYMANYSRRFAEGGEVTDEFPEEAGVMPDQNPSEAAKQMLFYKKTAAPTPPTDLARLGKQAGLIGLGFAPGAGVADYFGKFPAVEGGTEPSAVENFQKGNYGTAALQGLGAMGDLAMAVPVAGTAIGSVMKAPRAAQKMLQELKGSRVVDQSGEPLTVYHGTNTKNLKEFDTAKKGAWFSEDPYIAEAYTRREGADAGTIVSAKINVKNPLIVPQDIDMSKRYSVEEIINRINDDNATTYVPKDFGLKPNTEVPAFDVVSSPRFIKELKKGGFDGIKAYEGGYSTWNVFDNKQITSDFAKVEAPSVSTLPSSTTARDDLAKLLGYSEDIPNEKWLAGKVEDAVEGGTNSFGVPRRMGSTTGYFGKPVEVPVDLLAKLPGERGEQSNVRKDSLDYIRKNWDKVSKEPPYIEVDPFGKAWVSEGNHRIMVAKEKGLKTLPVDIRYFSGGQRKAGELAPEKILEYNLPNTTTAKEDLANVPGVLPKAERDANLNKMLEKSVVKEPVYHSTYSDFPEFKTNFGEDEYFQFGAHVGSVDAASNRLSLKQAEDAARGAKGSDTGANIMPVYAKITNPLRLDENRTGRWGVDDIMSTIMEKADAGDIKGIPPNIVDDFFDDNLQIEKFLGKKVKGEPRVWQNTMDWKPGERSKLLTEFIEKLGHDGIVYNNMFEGGGDSYLVLRPTQLKSATGNKGTFDTESPVLNKAKGGEVRKPK